MDQAQLAKKEEFKLYLEKTGVLDALTRVLVSLYEQQEKPTDALEFFLNHLSTGMPHKPQVDVLYSEVKQLRQAIANAEKDNAELREQLQKFESARVDVPKPVAQVQSGNANNVS